MSIILKNQTESDIYITGVDTIPASGQLTVDPSSYGYLRISNVFQFIWDDSIIVNDGQNDITDKISAQIFCQGSVTTDPDTGAQQITAKVGPPNSYEQHFETEWKTSTLNSIHEKDIDNVDIGWSSVKFYELVEGVETEMISPTQAELDASCIRTDLTWHPDIDYYIKSGKVGHPDATSENIYVWAVGSDGLGNFLFVEGGLNLRFLDAKDKVGVEGQAATHMPRYFQHPTYGQLDANKIRVVCRHPAGHAHSLQLILGIYRLKS